MRLEKHIKYEKLRILIVSKKYMLKIPLPLVRMNLNTLQVLMNSKLHNKALLAAIDDPIFDFKNETIHISPSGDMASYSHKLDMTFTSQGEPGKLEGVRVSGVLVKKGSSWKHVQLHWSIGVKGQVIEY